MINITRKYSHKYPGLRYKVKDGVFYGRLYTALPLRIRVAFFKVMQPYLIAFVLVVLIFPESEDIYNMLAAIFVIALFIVYPVYVLYDPGKRITISPEFLYLGISKYHLNEISNFSVKEIQNRENQYFLICDHGPKQKIIKIRNIHKHAYEIAECLNITKKAMLEKRQNAKQVGISRVELRSANF